MGAVHADDRSQRFQRRHGASVEELSPVGPAPQLFNQANDSVLCGPGSDADGPPVVGTRLSGFEIDAQPHKEARHHVVVRDGGHELNHLAWGQVLPRLFEDRVVHVDVLGQ
jgi:hypothetical protein